MKNKILVICLLVVLTMIGCSTNSKREGKPQVLIFTKTAGFVHSSIPDGVKAIVKLGLENNFEVDTTSNSLDFNDDNLKKYAAVIFLSTTGNVLDYKQEAAFERYIQSGGGFVGVHAATDTEYDWGWYGKLVGAYFKSHPHQQEAKFHIVNKDFPATEFLKDSTWTRFDELYNFKKINPDINVLLTIDESSYEGGANGDFHPMSWYHDYDGGRSFYTALGHTKESFVDDDFLQHLLGGIQYAIGDNLELNYKAAQSQLPPDPVRFTKMNLSSGEFFEPTEMTILPNLDVLVAQRRGEIMLYEHESKELRQVALLNVYHKTSIPGVNAEEGLMGLQKDPNYKINHWIYVFYSPTGDKWVNRLSRFTYKDGVFDLESEVIVLEVDSQREICCHTGGSIAFGPDGLLYLSTGDNSSPANEPGAKYVSSGYAPLNDIPGKELFDARRSSANTNDLRGKILRIKINDDGSYDIPEGNLFPVGKEKTRPEIYTMGHRNPYRISVDAKNGYVYWGDVGPDASVDSLQTRGPRGYDEMNQAKKAGNFGWPLFIADNKPYVNYDFESGVSGEHFDADKPINNSRNNTGLTELPPAQPAYAWYPYNTSADFPEVGTGGRNAMAGPVYYNDMYTKEKSLPTYYNGKVIIYDWMRGWMKAVSLFENGDFNKMEPFAPNVKLNNLIDMEVAPNGQIYLLEYGSGWFQKNDDSGLSYMEYTGGNLSPEISNFEMNKTSGMLPLNIHAMVDASDLESKNLRYNWDLGNGDVIETDVPKLEYTYSKGGEFKVQVTVSDEEGGSTQSEFISVVAGNERPIVKIDILSGNKSFYMQGRAIQYKVSVQDDQSSTAIDASSIFVSVDYLDGMDQASLNTGHQVVAASAMGKALTEAMDCKACHKEDGESIGPSYLDVAAKYKNDENAVSYLQNKIKTGGSGVWGEVSMAAHPDISKNDLSQITAYILSLSDDGSKKESLPVEGKIIPEAARPGRTMVIRASYTDKGEDEIKALTGSNSLVLPSSMVSFGGKMKLEGFRSFSFDGIPILILPSEKGWFALESLDLSNVKTATIIARWQGEMKVGLSVEARLDSPDGKLIGKGRMEVPHPGQNMGMIPIVLKPFDDGELHEIYFTYKADNPKLQMMTALVMVQFGG